MGNEKPQSENFSTILERIEKEIYKFLFIGPFAHPSRLLLEEKLSAQLTDEV